MFLTCLLVFVAWWITGENWLFLVGLLLIYPALESMDKRGKEEV